MGTRRDFLNQVTAVTVAAATASRGTSAAAVVPEAQRGSMTTYKIPGTDLRVSRIAAGGAGIGGKWDRGPINDLVRAEADRAIMTAYDNGITLFDNADMYAYGKAERVMGDVLKRSPGFRDKIIIQTKCGIHLSYPIDNPPPNDPHRFDFSYERIIRAVEESLRRLSTDRVDILLLHRPDPLVEPQEVAGAFDELHRSGKVRYFGVSNHTATQIELLKKYVRQPLVINQVQIGLMHSHLITDGLDFNRQDGRRLNQEYTGAGGTLEYCRLNDIQIQAYSPVRGLSITEESSATVKSTVGLLEKIGKDKDVSRYAIALAWLLRHPAGILPIIGAREPKHIIENCAADKINLTREEWYSLLLVSTGLSSVSML